MSKSPELPFLEWQLLPPPPDACQECGRVHPPEHPHDRQQLYYQYNFYGKFGRWPTWKDALAHCSPAMAALWEEELRLKGVWADGAPQ
jgi:hypothetical protein